MIHLPKRETKLLVAIHGWSGIVLGLLLYAVVLTGMVAVFAHEIGIWSVGATETRSPFSQPVDPTVRKLATQTPKEFHEAVDAFAGPKNELAVFFHRHETQPSGAVIDRGIYYAVDRQGEIVERREGTGEEIFGATNADALSSFLVDTHVRLHVPDPWGLLLTGILGLAMLVAAASGLLMHRHLLKDIFTLRHSARPVLAARDRHSVASTWSLPFAFLLAFTGSFFSFAGSLGIPAIAMVAFGGDQMAMIEKVFGAPAAADPRPSLTGNIDRAITDTTARGGSYPTFVQLGNFDRADAAITTFHEPREGGLEPLSYVYDGNTGEFANEKPSIGTTPSVGGSAFALMFPLHVGNFAGMLSKAVWLGLGFAMCFVTLSGMRLWLRKRIAEQAGLQRLDRTVSVIGFGLPFALAASAVGYLLTVAAGQAVFWTPTSFLIASALAIVLGLVRKDAEEISRWLGLATGATMIALPLLRLVTGGASWGEAMSAGQPIIVALDIFIAIAGVFMLRAMGLRLRRPASQPLQTLQPAE